MENRDSELLPLEPLHALAVITVICSCSPSLCHCRAFMVIVLSSCEEFSSSCGLHLSAGDCDSDYDRRVMCLCMLPSQFFSST